MTMKSGRYALRNIMKATVFDYKTNDVLFYLDYGVSAEEDWKANQTMVRGGDGATVRVIFNDSKDGQLKLSTEIFSLAQLAMLQGSLVSTGTKNLYANEVHTVIEDTTSTPSTFYVNLDQTPVDTNGDGTIDGSDVQVKEFVNGVQGDAITVGSVTAKKVVLTGVAGGDEVHVFFQRASSANAQTITNYADGFPPYVKIVGEALYADEVQGDLIYGQVEYPKAKVEPNYKLSYNATGNATQLDMIFDIMPVNRSGRDVMSELTLDEVAS